jgi:hypothetical protein
MKYIIQEPEEESRRVNKSSIRKRLVYFCAYWLKIENIFVDTL